LDNRLRETAVKVAVWASTQHIIGEVWFAGSRVTDGPGAAQTLDIIVTMRDHAQQVQLRRSGRQVSTASWETDLKSAVRKPHTLQIVNAAAPELGCDAVKLFSRGETRGDAQRSENFAADTGKPSTDVRGDHQNARTL
jgi:hypothetical protein